MTSHLDPDQSDKLDPDPHPRDGWIRINLQMTSQNEVWNMSLFEHFFKVLSGTLEPLFGSRIRIRIRIRIKVTSRIRIRINVMRIHNIVSYFLHVLQEHDADSEFMKQLSRH
jgi:hypothetical protein